MFTSAGNHRFGFGGMEKDDDWKGDGNSLDFGARIYDPRIGRFLSLDPDSPKYPFMSPYIYAAGSPIRLTDEDGRGPKDRVKFAMDFFGTPYKQETGELRTGNTQAALKNADCSELVSRVLVKDELISKGSNAAGLRDIFKKKLGRG